MTRRPAALGLVVVAALAAVAVRGAGSDPLLRTVPVAGQPIAVVVDERAGRAFVVDRGTNVNAGAVIMLATRDGAPLRTLYAGTAPWAAAVDTRTARVFVIDVASHGVAMLDTRSGAMRAASPVFPNPRSPDPNVGGVETIVTAVAVDEARGRAFVAVGSAYAGVPGGMTVFDAASGRSLEVVQVGQGVGSLAVDPSSGHIFVLDNVADRVSLVDVRTGALLHTAAVGQSPTAMALDARTRRLFVASAGASTVAGSPIGRGTISVLDARRGAVVRTVGVGIAPAALAVDEQTGRLFVADAGSVDAQGQYMGDGGIGVLDARTGALLRTVITAQSPRALAVDTRAGLLFAATRGGIAGPGSLLVLDARGGALLRTVPVGLSPTAVAVDQRQGRVFVTDAGGVMSAPQAWPWLPGSLRRWVGFLPGQQPSPRVVPASVSVFAIAS